MIENIEKSILCTVLENSIIGGDEKIVKVKLEANLFIVPFHKKLVSGIHRVKELNIPLDTDTVRAKFQQANKWTMQEDNMLIEIISHNCFGSYELFIRYYNLLKENHKNQVAKNILSEL